MVFSMVIGGNLEENRVILARSRSEDFLFISSDIIQLRKITDLQELIGINRYVHTTIAV